MGFERLFKVADSEPPRVRAMLGAMAEQLGEPFQNLCACKRGEGSLHFGLRGYPWINIVWRQQVGAAARVSTAKLSSVFSKLTNTLRYRLTGSMEVRTNSDQLNLGEDLGPFEQHGNQRCLNLDVHICSRRNQ